MVDLTAAAAALKESTEKAQTEHGDAEQAQVVPGEVQEGARHDEEPRTSTSGSGSAGGTSSTATGRKKLNNGMSIYLNAGGTSVLRPPAHASGFSM